MKKSKIILSSIFLAIAGLSIAGSGLVYTEPTRVLATVNDDGTFDAGDKTITFNTQSSVSNYSTIGSYQLYNAESEDETKALYTYQFTNCSKADSKDFISAVLTTSFGEKISVSVTNATNTSKRLIWLSHSFRLSGNLLKASKYGYLSVSVTADVQTPSNTYAKLNTFLYNGTLSESDISNITSNVFSIDKQIPESATKDVIKHTVTLSNQINSDYMLLFALNKAEDFPFFGTTMGMTITQPTLTISSSDVTAPSVEFTCDNTWKNTDKTLSIKVTDSESGIMSVTGVDGKELTIMTTSDKEQYYTMNIPENGDYSVVVTDNVGNSKTYTYTESHIDKTIPTAPIISMPALSYSQVVKVNLAEWANSISIEKVYYTIDGTTPTTASETLTAGDNDITFPWGNDILFKAIAIDEAGNASEIYSSYINVSKRYTATITTQYCNANVEYTPITTSNNGRDYYNGETVSLSFAYDQSKYQRRVIRIDGVEHELDGDNYSLEITKDVSVEVIYIRSLATEEWATDYTYNPNAYLTPHFTIKGKDNEPLDIGVNDLTIVVKDADTQEIVDKTKLQDAGTYTLSWEYYSYTCGGKGGFTFTISPKDVYIRVQEGQYKIYGNNDPVGFVYDVEGLPSGVQLEATLARVQGEDVGTYAISLQETNLSARNYNIDFTGENFTIRARKIVVSVDPKSKTYGEEDPELTYVISDGSVVYGDTPISTLTRVGGENVGTYAITTSATDSNYEVIITPSYLKIEPREITVTVDDDIEVTYGESAPLTYTVQLIGEDQLTGELTRDPGKDVGEYLISLGTLNNDNYILILANTAYYKITPKTITVTADNVEKVYGDSDDLTYTVDGLLQGDSLSGKLGRVTGENVGDYNILQGTLYNSNYTIEFVGGTLTILPATLTISIDDCSQVYGEDECELHYELDGIKYGDRITPILSRENGEDVGEYEISCTLDNDNYTLDIKKGTYCIEKATIIPTINSQKFVYSGNKNYVSSNFQFADELTFVYKHNGIECDGMLDAGEYTVVARFAGNKNYNAKDSKEYTFRVEKQSVYLTITNSSFIYDETLHLPEYLYDMSSGLDASKISFDFNGERPIEVGEYTFTAKCDDPNYDVNLSGTLTIANMFSVTNDNGSILECREATFDTLSQDIVLQEDHAKGKLNNEKIVNTCTFNNVSEDNDYIYTAKVKSTSDSQKIHVYQMNSNGDMREIVVSLEDGYYVFKVDNANDTFVITREKEPMPAWFWLVLIGGAVTALVVTLQVVKTNRKKKLAKAELAKDLDTYNIN